MIIITAYTKLCFKCFKYVDSFIPHNRSIVISTTVLILQRRKLEQGEVKYCLRSQS